MRLASLTLLGGCMMCPTGAMHGAPSDRVVGPSAAIDLTATYGDWRVGPDHCGGFWSVNQVEGGTAEVGTIDHCGHYVAPPTFVPGLSLIQIEATDFDQVVGGCADCCAVATIVLEPAP